MRHEIRICCAFCHFNLQLAIEATAAAAAALRGKYLNCNNFKHGIDDDVIRVCKAPPIVALPESWLLI